MQFKVLERKTLLLAALCATLGSSLGEIIPASRRIDWAKYAGVEGGVPDSTKMTVFANLTPSSTMSQINSAISSCPSNQVVSFGPGTYSFTSSMLIPNHGVVLRGAGPGKTIFTFNAGSLSGNIVFLGPGSVPDVANSAPPNLRNWTAGYAQGASSITLSSVSGLSIGTTIFLDQLNDEIDVSSTGTETQAYLGREAGRRTQLQAVTVTSINGNTVGINPPLYNSNWDAGRSPQAWWFNGTPLFKCGIENLTVQNVGGSGHQLLFINTRNCWVKNVRSDNLQSNGSEHVRTPWSTKMEVSHCYFYGAPGRSQSYGINFYQSFDCLAVDNIFEKVTSPTVTELGQGHAFLYNYSTNLYYALVPEWQIPCHSTHGSHCGFILFEGNYAQNFYFDDIHGSGSHNTIFRNRATGWETNKTMNTKAIAVDRFNHYINIVGNVLGTPNYHNSYECVNGQNTSGSIYYVGYPDPNGTMSGYDSRSASTLLRHGNYDVVSGMRWDSAIADRNIPSSLFYASRPSWYPTSLPWPPYDPANSISANSPMNIPAGYRFLTGQDPASGPINQPPTVNASATPLTSLGSAPLQVRFSASGTDPEGAPLTYRWDFGDGGTDTNPNPSHTYQADGKYTAFVTVSDGTNAVPSSPLTISIGNLAPVVSATATPTSGRPPLTVAFSSSGSADPEGAALTYTWNFGDGGTSTAPNPSHIYQSAGRYVARLTVSDGQKSAVSSDITIVASTGLVAAYGFDEASGATTKDTSLYANDGGIVGAATRGPGKFGSALTFDGSTSYVSVPSAESLNMTTAITMMAWVNPTQVDTAYRNIIYKPGDVYFIEGSTPANAPRFSGTFASANLDATSPLPANQWTHLAATYDGVTMNFYVNGVLNVSRPQSGPIGVSDYPLGIGGNSVNGQFWAGKIDEVRLYNRALSATEIQSDMNTPVSAGVGPGPNQPPTAKASATPTSGQPPLTVVFSSAGSSDPEGTALTYSWSFGDGTTSTAANPTHVYQTAGNFVARLTVSDGQTTTVSSDINITTGTGLVASFGFEEGSGTTVNDQSPNRNNGTVVGGAAWTSGKFGNGLQFDGTTSYVTVPNAQSLNITNTITMMAWVNPTKVDTAFRNIIYKPGDVYFIEGSTPNNTPRFSGTFASNGDLDATAPLPVGQWTHLAASYDGSVMNFYVNGVLSSSRAQSGPIGTSLDPLGIGGNAVNGQYWAGKIDEVRIYNRALSSTEIQSSMNTATAGKVAPAAPSGLRILP